MEQVGSDVVIVKSSYGDWVGLYVDGRLAMDGHSLRTEDVLEALGVEYDSREVNGSWLEVHDFPDCVDDVPLL